MKINSICVLGGGTAGFSVASVLARYRELSGLEFDIQVVHSDKIGSIGVGESTLLNINSFFEYLDLDDEAWMKKCNATYKASIRFENFNKGSHFYYPLGPMDSKIDCGYRGIHDWCRLSHYYPDVFTPEQVGTALASHGIYSEMNKLTRSGYDLDRNTAYHFDANLLGNVFKEYCEGLGVKVIDDTFKNSTMKEDGSIESLVCENGTYEADLFIDCSGFKSLLLGEVMGEEFISYDKTLINNKALVVKVPYKDKENQLKNYTNSVALDNGWVWETPLWDRLAYGYVHTNKFASEKEIEQEFFNHIGEEVDYKVVNFKTGRYKRGWVKNVVAVGLSYGFIEPLESTGITTTIDSIFRLIECLSMRDMNCTKLDKDSFNYSVGHRVDTTRTLVETHYFLSMRDDTSYWKYITEEIDFDDSNTAEFTYSEFINQACITRTYNRENEAAPEISYIALGMNHSILSKAVVLGQKLDLSWDCEQYKLMRNNLEMSVRYLPSTYRFLLEDIYKT